MNFIFGGCLPSGPKMEGFNFERNLLGVRVNTCGAGTLTQTECDRSKIKFASWGLAEFLIGRARGTVAWVQICIAGLWSTPHPHPRFGLLPGSNTYVGLLYTWISFCDVLGEERGRRDYQVTGSVHLSNSQLPTVSQAVAVRGLHVRMACVYGSLCSNLIHCNIYL